MTPIDRDTLTLIDGSTFCVSDGSGVVLADRAHGLFVRDIRMVSRWAVLVDGRPGQPVHAATDEPFEATVLVHVPAPAHDPGAAAVLLVRRRVVGEGMREELRLRNDTGRTRRCTVTLEFGVDFADLFAVKGGHDRVGAEAVTVPRDGALVADAVRHGREHAVEVGGEGAPSARSGILEWQVEVPARGEWSAGVTVRVVVDGRRLVPAHARGSGEEHSVPARALRGRERGAPRVETADRDLAATLTRGVEDLGALRIFDPAHPERAVLAAGAPWYMALFGRDSLLTALMLLPLDPGLAVGTLRTLADHQGRRADPVSEEQPGRIPHQIRFGSPSAPAPEGGGDYYGTADAPALFVVVLGELARWTGITPDVEALLPHADRALAWIAGDGDPDGDGFVEYRRSSPEGLLHQGWKDSQDAVCFADGTPANPPIALAEVQAYGYAAHRARARLADALGDGATAGEHRERAYALRRAFRERFWLPEQCCLALALDADERPVDGLASNMGHCLWAGIVESDHARAVADHLLSPAMFSGWGIRTLATTMGAYDPMSYHNGSVWPHDTALCVAGLERYGFVAEARRVAVALLEAAAAFGHRLPELFCGFGRAEFASPVPYPTSCSPQAWAAAAPLSLVRSLLRLDPDVPGGTVRCGPALPEAQLPFLARGLRIGGQVIEIAVDEAGWSISGLGDTGLVVAPRP